MLRGTVLFTECLHPAHLQTGLGENAEVLGQLFVHTAQKFVGQIQIGLTTLISIREIELVVFADKHKELCQRAIKFYLLLDGFHLGAQARYFGQTNFVNLISRQVQGSIQVQSGIIKRTTIG